MSEAAARALAKNPKVAWVEENSVGTADVTQSSAPWGLDRIDQQVRPLSSTYNYAFDGNGIHAYVIDSGIRNTYAEFGTRATLDWDWVGDGQNGFDCNGHGTHVAGILGGNAYGVAKGAGCTPCASSTATAPATSAAPSTPSTG
jgi:subtilisin family serine protease